MPVTQRIKELPLVALAVPSLILGLVLASSGFDLLPDIGVFNAKRVLEPVVFGVALLISLLNSELRSAFAGQCARIPAFAALGIIAVFALGAISALRFPHPGYGLAELTLLALITVLIPLLAACRVVAGGWFDRWVLSLVAMLGLIVAATEFTGLLVGWSLGTEFGFEEMLVRFAHPRFYNQLQSWTLPVLAAIPLVFASGLKQKIIATMLIGFQWAIVLMSGGRGSFLALLISLLAIAALARPGWDSWLRTHLFGALVSAIIFAGILGGHSLLAPSGGNFLENSVGRSMTHSTGRTFMWKLAAEDAKAHPWLGAGPMRFNCDGPGIWPAHPHSFPMQLLSEWGIPAVAIILGLFGWLAFRLAEHLRGSRDQDPAGQGLKQLLAACVLAASLHACLSGVLIMPASQMMAVIMCGWLLGVIPAGSTARSHGSRILAPGLALAGLIACSALTVFNISELGQYEARIEVLDKAGPVQPRYWQHGRSCLYSGY